MQNSILYAKGRTPFSYVCAALATKAYFFEAKSLIYFFPKKQNRRKFPCPTYKEKHEKRYGEIKKPKNVHIKRKNKREKCPRNHYEIKQIKKFYGVTVGMWRLTGVPKGYSRTEADKHHRNKPKRKKVELQLHRRGMKIDPVQFKNSTEEKRKNKPSKRNMQNFQNGRSVFKIYMPS